MKAADHAKKKTRAGQQKPLAVITILSNSIRGADTYGETGAARPTAAAAAPASTLLLDTPSAVACSEHTAGELPVRKANPEGKAVGTNASAASSAHRPAQKHDLKTTFAMHRPLELPALNLAFRTAIVCRAFVSRFDSPIPTPFFSLAAYAPLREAQTKCRITHPVSLHRRRLDAS